MISFRIDWLDLLAVQGSESEEVRLASAVAVEAVPISLGVVTAFSA